MTSGYCIFEYRYRDAGNWKTHGALLLAGDVGGARETLSACLDSGELFVAEQVDVPSLCEQHWADCGDGPSDLDHAYHEFVDLRCAREEEVAVGLVIGELAELLERFRDSAGRWDVSLSPNCLLQEGGEVARLVETVHRDTDRSIQSDLAATLERRR